MFRQRTTFFALLIMLMAMACAKKETIDSSIPNATETSAPIAVVKPSEGASSGGGGYVSENSKKVLVEAQKILNRKMQNASLAVFVDLPTGWDRARLSKVIMEMRLNPLKEAQRDGQDLMFNYGKDEKGEFLEVLKPFFTAYASVPIKFKLEQNASEASYREYKAFEKILLDVQLKMLHESGHLMGYNEEDSEKFGQAILERFERDVYYCEVPLEKVKEVPNVLWVSPASNYWIDPKGNVSHEPKKGWKKAWDFNWIHGNGWFIQKSKAKIRFHLGLSTYYGYQQSAGSTKSYQNKSYLDRFLENLDKKDPNNFILDTGFIDAIGVQAEDDKTVIEYDEKALMNSSYPTKLRLKLTPDAVLAFDFSSATVDVPLMTVTDNFPEEEKPAFVDYELAPRGKEQKGFHRFNLKCEYLANRFKSKQ
jgi:hypothetical protein